MIKVYSSAMKKASDFLNRVKGDDVYIKSVNGQVCFVGNIDSVWAYYDLGVQSKEDMNFKVDLGKTVEFNRMIGYFEKDGLDIIMEFKEKELIISNKNRSLKRPIEHFDMDDLNKSDNPLGVNVLGGEEFKEVVDSLGSLRGNNKARPELEGIRLDSNGFVALDGYVLGLYHKELDVHEDFVINNVATTILKRLLVKHKGEYKITEYSNHIVIETDNIMMHLDEKVKAYFDYGKVIAEDNFEFKLRLDLDELIDNMKYLSNSEEFTLTKIIDDEMTSKVVEAGREASTVNKYEHIEGVVDKDFSIYYNNSYMLKVLSLFDDEDVVFSYKNGVDGNPSINPMLVTGEKYTGLVLPMRKGGVIK